MATEYTSNGNGNGSGSHARLDPSHPLLEAMREASGQILAEEQHRWARERALMEAQTLKAIAEAKAEISDLRNQLERGIAEKLATVRDGAPGAPGAPGPKGEAGAAGRDGRLRTVRDWSEGVHYEGEVVVRNGALFQCTQDTGHPLPMKTGHASPARGAMVVRRRFAALGSLTAITTRSTSAPWAAARSSRSRTIRVFVPGMAGSSSRGRVKEESQGLVASAANGGPLACRRRQSPAGLSKRNSVIPVMFNGSHGPRLDLRPLFEHYNSQTF
jgi:hypothetical protein